MSEDIRYRPRLAPKRYFHAEGSIPSRSDAPISNIPLKETKTPSEVIETLDLLIEVFRELPKEVHFFSETLTKMKERMQVLFPKGTIRYQEKVDRTLITNEVHQDAPTMHRMQKGKMKVRTKEGTLSLFPKAPLVSVYLHKGESAIDLLRKDYVTGNLELHHYVMNKLLLLIMDYLKKGHMILLEIGADTLNDLLEEEVDRSLFRGKRHLHLRDEMTRAREEKKQVGLLFKKTHAVDNTLMHYRTFEAMAKERIRYYEEKRDMPSRFTDVMGNDMLKKVRDAQDEKYKGAYASLFKYFNSSALLVRDILFLSLTEMYAKGKLLGSTEHHDEGMVDSAPIGEEDASQEEEKGASYEHS